MLAEMAKSLWESYPSDNRICLKEALFLNIIWELGLILRRENPALGLFFVLIQAPIEVCRGRIEMKQRQQQIGA